MSNLKRICQEVIEAYTDFSEKEASSFNFPGNADKMARAMLVMEQALNNSQKALKAMTNLTCSFGMCRARTEHVNDDYCHYHKAGLEGYITNKEALFQAEAIMKGEK